LRVKWVVKIKLITVHRKTSYPVFWRQGVQNSTQSPETKTEFVDVTITVWKNVEVIAYIRWLPYASSRTDHSALIILPFDMCNLCDRRRYAGDKTTTKTTKTTTIKIMKAILHGRNTITCSTNCKYRIAATSCTQKTWFISGTYL